MYAPYFASRRPEPSQIYEEGNAATGACPSQNENNFNAGGSAVAVRVGDSVNNRPGASPIAQASRATG
jgi:hypothetical protein